MLKKVSGTLFEALMLELDSDTSVDQMRHYEIVYLIHEKHEEQVAAVNEKIQGMRRLAYKIKKAKNAHYILMNFELDAKYINKFKTILDQDERVIRHLVIKRDEAITEDCPPPPEFHTLRAGADDDYDDEGYETEYDEDFDDDWDGEDDDDGEIIIVDDDDDGRDHRNDTSANMIQPDRKLRAGNVAR
ncbi:30S ribosomal protein [Arachis hypogaea]|nr:30S ribosomal protein [Arachis hypogaea]